MQLRRFVLASFALVPLAAAPPALPAQGTARDTTPPQPAQRPQRPQPAREGPTAPYDSFAFRALKWRELGPYRGGRSVAVAGSPSRPHEYYMGTTGGGVFKTGDGGVTWAPVTDKYFGGTIGAIGVSETNPDVVYVGTGEYPIRGNVSHGDGVFKSIDAGKTWRFIGLGDTRQISRVRVHPRNPDVVWVGAQGQVYGPSSARGVFKTTDGGRTWRRVLFRSDTAGVTDLVLDPTNPDVLYAAFWHAYRTPWLLVSGGSGSGIFKSIDGGEHWTEVTRNAGLPKGVIGNIGLAVSPAKPSRVWAIVEADSGGVFRSDDGGQTWTRTNEERKLRQRAWYYSRIFADPKDTSSVYVLNTGFYRSVDNGKTFKSIKVPHGDNHDLWIAPNDPARMIEANDGGANVSFNGGKSWTAQDYATAQFYHVTTTNHFPYHVCGAQQDNSTLCGPSRAAGGVSIEEWKDAGGGESGYIAARADQPDVVFAGSYGGLTTRKDMRTGLERDVNPWPDNPMGHSAGDLKYRFQWTFPIVLSPSDPNTLYVAANVLFKSTNEGQTFTQISPDLTRHDPRTLGPSGGPITKDQTSVEYYGTIFTVAESPAKAGVIWTGSDDGLIHVSRNGGRSWTNVTPKAMPEWGRVSMIEASRYAPGTAYAAVNHYQLGDLAPYIFRTTDFGKTWTKITAGIASTEFVRVVREDHQRPGLLYAGTERGVWVSFDDGGRWQKLQLNLPPVPVHDLAVKQGDLIAATHGRSFWILDDLSALREMAPAVVQSKAHLFKPRPAYRVGFGGGGDTGAAGTPPSAKNPSAGARIYYWLATAGDPTHEVKLDFFDDRGRLIRSLTSKQDSASAADSVKAASTKHLRTDSLKKAGVAPDTAAQEEAKGEESEEEEESPRKIPRPPRVPDKAGLNVFVWNLRYPDASSFENMILWAGGVQGPVAPPGRYMVRLTANGVVQTDTFTLRKDPRSPATPAELGEQFALLMKIRERFSEANEAVKSIRAVKAQLAERKQRVPPARAAAFLVSATALAERLGAIETELYQVKNQASQDPLNYPIRLNNKLAALAGVVATAEARPTDQSYAVFNTLSGQLDRQLAAMRGAMERLLPRVNAELVKVGEREIEGQARGTKD